MPQTIQRSFTSGEISPALQSRADIVKYSTGLNLCENFFVRSQGGIYSRPGFGFKGEQKDSSKKGRLIPFSFNTQQTYILVFEEFIIRFMKGGAFILKPLVAVTDVTQSNPAVVTTAVPHGFVTGEEVDVSGIVGMTELNGNKYTITVSTSTIFTLDNVDSTAFTPYVSDGVMQSDGIFEITTPYTELELPRLAYTQSADVMTIVHPNHDPRDLSRLADDNWTLTVINYSSTVSPPIFSGLSIKNITGITQSLPAVVTSVAHGLSIGNTVTIDGVVGMINFNGGSYKITPISFDAFQLDGTDSTSYSPYISDGVATIVTSIVTIGTGFGTFNKTYTYVITAVDTNGVESLASTSASITSLSLTQTGGVRLMWNAVPNAIYYRIYKDPSRDTQIYGWIGDSNNVTFDDYNIAPLTNDAPPENRQPFQGVGNKPSAVNYYQQRQVFANSLNEPQVTLTTQVNNFKSLRTSNPARDDDAVTFTIAAQQVNEIRHIMSLDSMLLLTSGGEWLVSEGQNKVLTPSTVGVRIQSYNGSSWVKPVIINSTALYLQEKNARIRDLNYEFSSDKYTGNDLSLMAEHLFEDFEITEMAYADEPYGILWCVRSDGTLLGLTYQREHQVWGWHHHVTDGEFESVATISEDGRDALYVIVNRVIGGEVKRFIERLEKRESKKSEDAFYVDSGLSYDGVPITNVIGLDHLEGKEVSILTDGYVTENQIVTNGGITLSIPASKIHVGLPYVPVIETLDIDTASTTDTIKAQSVSVSKVTIEVEKSRGGFVGARQDVTNSVDITMQEIKPRFEDDNYDSISLKTYKQEVIIEPSWNKGGGLRIEQRSPLPLAILSIIPRVDIGGS